MFKGLKTRGSVQQAKIKSVLTDWVKVKCRSRSRCNRVQSLLVILGSYNPDYTYPHGTQFYLTRFFLTLTFWSFGANRASTTFFGGASMRLGILFAGRPRLR